MGGPGPEDLLTCAFPCTFPLQPVGSRQEAGHEGSCVLLEETPKVEVQVVSTGKQSQLDFRIEVAQY